MSKVKLVVLAIMGACSVIIDIMTPLAVALFWGSFFGLSEFASSVVLVIGGIATMFRAIKIWFVK